MDNFKAVYKILATLEIAMDLPKFDASQIGPDVLGVSNERWARYLEMMVDVGYIKGVNIKQDILGDIHVTSSNMRITLKGLEYLQENATMRKIYNAAKGFVEIVT